MVLATIYVIPKMQNSENPEINSSSTVYRWAKPHHLIEIHTPTSKYSNTAQEELSSKNFLSQPSKL